MQKRVSRPAHVRLRINTDSGAVTDGALSGLRRQGLDGSSAQPGEGLVTVAAGISITFGSVGDTSSDVRPVRRQCSRQSLSLGLKPNRHHHRSALPLHGYDLDREAWMASEVSCWTIRPDMRFTQREHQAARRQALIDTGYRRTQIRFPTRCQGRQAPTSGKPPRLQADGDHSSTGHRGASCHCFVVIGAGRLRTAGELPFSLAVLSIWIACFWRGQTLAGRRCGGATWCGTQAPHRWCLHGRN